VATNSSQEKASNPIEYRRRLPQPAVINSRNQHSSVLPSAMTPELSIEPVCSVGKKGCQEIAVPTR